MRASIIIAAHNEGPRLARTVESVVDSAGALDYEIIIADDASDDGSIEETLRRFPRVRVVRHDPIVASSLRERADSRKTTIDLSRSESPRPLGCSPTKDLGARHARGEVLVFLDGHTLPDADAIRRLVEDVERTGGQAIMTACILGLDADRWLLNRSQRGYGYRLDLETMSAGWLPLSHLKPVRQGGREFYESPAFIGCAFAISRELYDKLHGFDPHMFVWGVEDVDLALRSWLMGHPILHDPEPCVGHRFRRTFDNYEVPREHVLANQIRMAYKCYSPSPFAVWLDRQRQRYSIALPDHPEGLFTAAWTQFEAHRPSAETQRAHLHARRTHDELWYAVRFDLPWPRLAGEGIEPGSQMFALMEGSSPPPPCGATLRFLDNENNEISPETKALNVSNYVTDNGFPPDSAFGDDCDDPSNFRLEVEDEEAEGESVSVTLKVGDRDPIEYTLDKKSGNKFRGKFLRLVTDGPDDAVQGTQTVLCKLGEAVVLTYRRAGEEECEDQSTIGIGRPTDEDDNGADQLKHDIRELKVHVVVFSTPGTTKLDGAIDADDVKIKVDNVANAHPSGVIKIEDEVIEYTGIDTDTNEFIGCMRGREGTDPAMHADDTDVLYSTTTPVITRAGVIADLDTVDERFAQATIRLARDQQGTIEIDMGEEGDPGVALPGKMLDGFLRSIGVLIPTEDEEAIVAFKDADENSIDVFYVEKIFRVENPAAEVPAVAYNQDRNRTGNPALQNFVVLSGPSKRVFSLPHEFMHILWNGPHRGGEPQTALFWAPTSPNKDVDGTKRIGPYPDAETAGIGNDDTTTIRSTAEDLP